jgi:hypothetical protein
MDFEMVVGADGVHWFVLNKEKGIIPNFPSIYKSNNSEGASYPYQVSQLGTDTRFFQTLDGAKSYISEKFKDN